MNNNTDNKFNDKMAELYDKHLQNLSQIVLREDFGDICKAHELPVEAIARAKQALEMRVSWIKENRRPKAKFSFHKFIFPVDCATENNKVIVRGAWRAHEIA
jgi:hypothetical protein